MKKILSVILVAVIAIAGYKFYTEKLSGDDDFLLKTGTDEERIADTLEKYAEYFNDGDFDSLVKCHTKRMQTDLKSQMGIGSSLFGDVVSFVTSGILGSAGDTLESIWALGTAYCQIDLELLDVYYFSDNEAEAQVNYIEKENGRVTNAYIKLEKKNEAWYVASDFYEYSQK